MALNEKYKKKLIEIIEQKLPKAKIILFGSRATGAGTSQSDIDLALDAGEKISFELLLQILSLINESVVPMKVDLVDINTATEELKSVISREGIVWKS